MGTCLAVIKVIGTTSLGLYAGAVLTATSGYDILLYVLQSGSQDINRSHGLIKDKLKKVGGIASSLGVISTIAFQLAYSGAPRSMKHPYLIYSSLVFPVSLSVWYLISGTSVMKWFKMSYEKEVISDLDNSIYKDLGDEQVSNEVESHLIQQVAVDSIEKLQLGNKIVSCISVLGFIIATVGVYGDY